MFPAWGLSTRTVLEEPSVYTVNEDENGVTAVFDVTGYKMEDLDVYVRGGFLCVDGENKVDEVKDFFSQRNLNLRIGLRQDAYDMSRVEAKLEGNELTVTIGTPKPIEKRKIPITTS